MDAKNRRPRASGESARRRVANVDWQAIEVSLDERGYARTPPLLTVAECRALIRTFGDETRFRSHVVMERHRFGVGEYRYFAAPLPTEVQALREALYAPLARIANRWAQQLGSTERYAAQLDAFLAHCHRHEQRRPTPLLLRYAAGGYNRLHQDLYGDVAFPLQATLLLSEPGRDFEGGEFLLTEQRPRQQSRGSAITLERGAAVLFPNAARPVRGVRGMLRAGHRHGVSEITRGERFALGVIFHDSR